MSLFAWAAFVAAGAAGAVARHVLGTAISDRTQARFPWGTFLVNTTGSFLFGLITGLAVDHGLQREPRLVLGTGFCGAFTTFSTFTYETLRLIEDGNLKDGVGNVAGTLVIGALSAAAGLAITGA